MSRPCGADQRVCVGGDRRDLGVQLGEGAHRLLAHVRDHDLGAVREQVPDEVAADLADARDADLAAAQRRVAPQVLGRGPHALEDAEGGQHGRVARAAVLGGAAGGPLAGARHDVHVGDVGADVAGRHVAPAERGHEPAVGEQQVFGLDRLGVADDHGLAAAVVEPGHGVLVRHPARQVERVGDGLGLGGVRVEARTAQGGAQGGGVDGDDGPEPGGSVLAEHDLLVSALVGAEEGVQYVIGSGHIGHGGDSQVRSGG